VTIPFLSVKPKSIKLKVSPKFPAQLLGGSGVAVNKANGNYTIDLAFNEFGQSLSLPPNPYTIVYDPILKVYSLVPPSVFSGTVPEAPIDAFTYGRASAAWAKVLPLAGGTLTGPVIAAADPVTALGLVTKQYVDTRATPGQLPGTTTNDNASAGNIGEYISANLASGSAVVLTTAVAKDIVTISLTAGDWDVWGSVVTLPVGAVACTQIITWISTVANTLPTLPNNGANLMLQLAFTSAASQCLPAGRTRLSLASTTTVRLGTQCAFSGGTSLSAYGFIAARRAR
jgi:hypothetical protein